MKTCSKAKSSLRKQLFLRAPCCWGRFARRKICNSATEIPIQRYISLIFKFKCQLLSHFWYLLFLILWHQLEIWAILTKTQGLLKLMGQKSIQFAFIT